MTERQLALHGAWLKACDLWQEAVASQHGTIDYRNELHDLCAALYKLCH